MINAECVLADVIIEYFLRFFFIHFRNLYKVVLIFDIKLFHKTTFLLITLQVYILTNL